MTCEAEETAQTKAEIQKNVSEWLGRWSNGLGMGWG